VWDDGRFGLDEGTQQTSVYQDVATSGCSTEFAAPSWQTSLLAGSGCSKRATADLSAAATFFYQGTTAEPYPIGAEQGIAVYASIIGNEASIIGFPNNWGPVEGTSAASPMVAAIYTRLGLTAEASSDLSWTYKNAAAFNDVGSTAYPIPSGLSNTDAPDAGACGILCTAGPGWDGPTGVGSPNGVKLAQTQAGGSSSGGTSSGGGGDGGLIGANEDGGGTGVITGSGTATAGCSCSVVGGDGRGSGLAALFGSALGFAALGSRRRRARG
jgi:hypothetical protein